MGKHFGKKCFLLFLVPLSEEQLCSNNRGRSAFSVHSFGSALFCFLGGSNVTIAFFGHAHYVEKKEDEERILALLEEKIGDADAELYLGGYGGFDAFARSCGAKYRKSHPNTKLIFITPYVTRDYPKDLYDGSIYPSLERVPPRFAIQSRNKWMAENANFVIVYVKATYGGAYNAYRHALKKEKDTVNIAAENPSSKK